jgi:hypothetical protein
MSWFILEARTNRDSPSLAINGGLTRAHTHKN